MARSIIARDDTLLGVCQAIGEDFGFHPNFLRVLFAGILFVLASVAFARVAGPDRTPPKFGGLDSATTCIPGPIGGQSASYDLWVKADFNGNTQMVYSGESFGIDGPIPSIPDEIRIEAMQRYIEAVERITGQAFVPDVEEPIARMTRNLRAAGFDA